ncbi:unnamed protein product [Sympodiomycopsis kandeliae]
MAQRQQPADFQELEDRLTQTSSSRVTPANADVPTLAKHITSQWYTRPIAKPTIVDLVSEFAVQELVAIDGDSLLAHCLQTANKISQSSSTIGFQPLTVIYQVENFLSHLHKARLNYSIVWFNDRAVVSTSSSRTDSPASTSSRKLIRSLVKHHIDTQCHTLQQASFPSIDSPQWRKWLELERPYAIFTSDGAIAPQGTNTEAADTLAIAQHLTGGLQQDAAAEAISVVLMDDDMVHDDKVLVFLIETTPLLRHAIRLQETALSDLKQRITTANSSAASTASSLPDLPSGVTDASPSEQVALLVASNSQADASHRSALLLQAILISSLTLEARALPNVSEEDFSLQGAAEQFLAGAFELADTWVARTSSAEPEVSDLLDPKLFTFCLQHQGPLVAALPSELRQRFESLLKAVGAQLPQSSSTSELPVLDSSDAEPSCLPYNAPFDADLPRLPTSQQPSEASEPSSFLPRLTAAAEKAQLQVSSPFSQYRKTGKDAKVIRDASGRPINRLQGRRFKADQKYAAWVAAYAQSLLGSAGLTRQVITEGGMVQAVSSTPASNGPQEAAGSSSNKKQAGGKPDKREKGGAGGKKALSKKEQIIAQNQARKQDKASASVERKLAYLLEELSIGPATSKFEGADESMLTERRAQIASLAPYVTSAGSAESSRDLRLLRVRLAVEGWVCACTIEKREAAYDLAVSAFTDVGHILQNVPADKFNEHEKALLCSTGQALRVLGLQGVYGPSHAGLGKVWDEVEEKKGKPKKGEFPFDVNWPKASKRYIVGDPLDFQLLHCGDVMERQLDSKEDKRVATFKPDGWQRKVLDSVDAKESTLVVAPTSAGKTFVAFYTIEKALRESSDAVVVYVAPTKALVNQIAAELEARYTKNFGTSERTIWAISSGDFDVHNPLKCQVLVAAPQVLHKMCLQPDIAGSWLPRVKTVIMDEIHSLTDIELGAVWQQLLALVPAPIIALSATIGNVEEFGRWLGEVRGRHGQKLTVVQHSTRYSDLKKRVYLPDSERKAFAGITKPVAHEMFRPLHPFTALRPIGASMPSDLELTPGEQLELVRKMKEVADEGRGYPLSDDLLPENFFAEIIGPLKRADTLKYQEALRNALRSWMSQHDSREEGSPFLALIDSLEQGLPKALAQADKEWLPGTTAHSDFQKENLLPLLGGMHRESLLPALAFNFSRDDVETLGQHLVEELLAKENDFKGNNKAWKAKVAEWEQWQNDEPARRKAEEKKMKAIKSREEAEAMKKDTRSADAGWQASFDPEAPLADYTFANEKCGLALEDIVVDVDRLSCSQWMKDGLIRGVAIHHTGLPNYYRQIVERWFRKGWLRVVICTGSLALGINMPARTSIFIGDHVELNAIQYRQAAGRAGRRGMDLSGNVLFYGLSLPKIQRLLTSRLPSLTCDYPSSTTLNLRLHSLMMNGDAASKSLGQKMTSSVVGLNNPPMRDNELGMPLQFRLSVEFLRRFGLLSTDGQPLALTGLASDLSISEPSNIAFIELLRSGAFYQIASSATTDRIQAVDDMVTVLAHLFANRPVNPTSRFEDHGHTGREDVLPPLPSSARKVLEKLNEQIKQTYKDVASNVARQEDASPLGVSGVSVHDDGETAPWGRSSSLRSPYVAMGGSELGDDLGLESRATLRSGLNFTPLVLPCLDGLLSTSRERNSYLLHFFKDGNLDAMVTSCGLPGKGEAWALLMNFWQVLISIRSGLETLLKTGARTRSTAMKKGVGKTTVVSGAELDSWDMDDDDASVTSSNVNSNSGGINNYNYTDDPDMNLDDDEGETAIDSGIAGSQMSSSARPTATLHTAGQVRTRSGRKVEDLPGLIEIPSHAKHTQLWSVYELLVDIQRVYHARFFKTFA